MNTQKPVAAHRNRRHRDHRCKLGDTTISPTASMSRPRDPAPGAEAALRSYVEGAWGRVTKLGLAPGASPDRLNFTSDMTQALADADLVQERRAGTPGTESQAVRRHRRCHSTRGDHRLELIGHPR